MKDYRLSVPWAVLLGGVFPIILGVALPFAIPTEKWIQFPFHSLLEALGLFAGIALAIILLMQQKKRADSSYIWIASALIGMGILDAFHSGTQFTTGTRFVWLYSIAMLTGGLFFALAWWPLGSQLRTTNILPWFVAIAAIIVGISSSAFPESLPVMLADGEFTQTALAVNIISGILFFVGAAYFLVQFRSSRDTLNIFIAFFCLLNGSAGILFPISGPWQLDWWLWHVLRLAAYLIVLVYAFVTFKRSQVQITDLQKAQDEISLIFNTASGGMRLINKDFNMVRTNTAMANLTGMTNEEMSERKCFDVFKGDLCHTKECPLTTIPEPNTSLKREIAKYRQDGTEVICNLTASPMFDEQGTLTGILEDFVDITEQKKATEEINRHREQLERVLQDVQEAADVLNTSATELVAASTQLATTSNETATAVGETSTTLEEVTKTAEVSSDKARYVSENAQKTTQVAQQGKKAVEDLIALMGDIRERMESIAESTVKLSEQNQTIGEIIAVVNDIADQSNLLAVNGAIEAAKAGDQGKGFVVVAHEIKSLAEQSKQATARVRKILTDIQRGTSSAVMATEQGNKAVEAGIDQSATAGEAIRTLTDNIVEASQASIQIAASIQQQKIGMDQLGQAMESIRQASEQNAASTKQAEDTAKNLHGLAQKLKGLME